MTFTSIPPSLKPVVEDVAEALATSRDYTLSSESTLIQGWMREDAEAAILAFLNACVERGVGYTTHSPRRFMMYDPGPHDVFGINLGATDDTA